MKELVPRTYAFAEYELDLTRRLLLREGQSIPLNAKAFDLLFVLIENRERVIAKEELMNLVWRDQFVEEANLTVQISALRKALAEKKDEHRFIVTVHGHGYRFVAKVTTGSVKPDIESDVIIETQSTSRVLIEEEVLTDPEIRATPVALPEPSAISDRRSNVRPVIAAVGLLSVLLAAAIGFWRYKERQASRAAGPVIPFQQIDIKRLTNIGDVANAVLSPDGKLFVYSIIGGKDGRRSLWLGHAEGGEPVQIRPPAEVIHRCLTFAPDGSSLYFTESEDFSPGALYRMPVFGGVPEKIKENIPEDVAFAPDGKRFAFVRGDGASGKTSLIVADVANATEREIASRPNSIGFVADNPAWSPNGSLIAVGAVNDDRSSKQEVFVVRVADGSVRQLTALAWTEVFAVQWLKDSSGLIVVAKETDAPLAAQLWHISSTDGKARRIVADLNAYGTILSLSANNDSLLAVQTQNFSNIWVAPADQLRQARQITFGTSFLGSYGLDWTPDGRIVHTARLDQSWTIWATDSAGGNQRPLLPTGHKNINLSVTGDGRYLIFQSDRNGGLEVWRAEADGSDMRQLTTGGNNSHPHVSPDGKWVVYRSDRQGSGALWRVSIDGGEPVRLTEQAASWPRVSPDGRFIACGFNTDGKVKLAIIPFEGGTPVKVFDVPRLAVFGYGVRWTPDGKAVTYHDWANGIWKQSFDGGEPERLAGLPEEKLFAHGWSRDGKLFAFARGTQIRDVVLIRDLK